MIRPIIFLFALLAFAGQPRPDFTGYWVAELKGTPYLTLEIKHGSSFSGAISTGSVNADAEGKVSEVVEPAGLPRKIVDVRVGPTGKLLFASKEGGGWTTEYEMELTQPDRASLKIDGMPVKPFDLSRKKLLVSNPASRLRSLFR
jgi:hypothetical protein